jgi:hypothetical protein
MVRDAQFDHENYMSVKGQNPQPSQISVTYAGVQWNITSRRSEANWDWSEYCAGLPSSFCHFTVLFGVGVSVDHVLGAQWLIKVMSSLGYSI